MGKEHSRKMYEVYLKAGNVVATQRLEEIYPDFKKKPVEEPESSGLTKIKKSK